jgi:alginate O-acetyltransferase complex protein AlgF
MIRRTALFALAALFAGLAAAQQTGLLYDPEPPANSAYVRVIVAAAGPAMTLTVDGKPRGGALAAGEPGEYLVLPAGTHQLKLTAGREVLETTLEAPAGKALTLAFTARAAGTQPLRFEDKANTNKLKAVLTAYHLAPGVGPVDVTAGDRAQVVFPAIAEGASVSRPVNPLNIGFGLAANGAPLATPGAPLAMEYGGTYSLFILPGTPQPTLKAVLNRVERYTGTP